MNLSIKNSSLFLAIAMTMLNLFLLVIKIPLCREIIMGLYLFDIYLWDYFYVMVFSLIAVFGFVLFVNKEQVPHLSKSLRRYTLVIFIGMTFEMLNVLMDIATYSFYPYIPFFYWDPVYHTIILLLITIWFWRFAFMKPEAYFHSKKLGMFGIVSSIAISILLLMTLVSFVHVLFTGHVIGLQTTFLFSWIIPISFCVLFGIYFFETRNQK